MIAAAILTAAIVGVVLIGWQSITKGFGQDIADTLNNPHDGPDYEANVNARWSR